MKRVGVGVGVAALLLAGCGPKHVAAPPSPPITLHVEPACDLAPAAGVAWLIEAKPRAIASVPDLIPAIGLVLPEPRLQLFTASHGGIDLRQIKDLCVAQYKESQLQVANVIFDPEKVAIAFDKRAKDPATRTLLAPNPKVQSLVGQVADEPQRLITFGVDAVALERGKPGPMRAAEAFAFGRLKRALPALKGAALKRASDVLGDAVFRVFAAGPFDETIAHGVGGLLRATTAVGVSVTSGEQTQLDVKVVMIGAWGADGPAAAERLAATANVLSDSAIGRLFAMNQPIRSPHAHAEEDALVLEATFDANLLAKGLHDALDADVEEIMRH